MQKRSERGGHGVRNRRKKERGGWGGRKGGRKRGENPGKKRINHPKKAQNAGKHLCVFPGSEIPYAAPFPIYTFSFLSPSLHRVYFALKDANIDFLCPPHPPPLNPSLFLCGGSFHSDREKAAGGRKAEELRGVTRAESNVIRRRPSRSLCVRPSISRGGHRGMGGTKTGHSFYPFPPRKK